MKYDSGFVEKYWNQVVRNDWPTKKRDYIRASELGNPFCDRYLSMMGVEPTNGFSDRTLRIFDAGNVIEWMVIRALELSGLLNKNQAWLELPASPKYIKVLGRLDATIGGFTSWAEVDRRVEQAVEKYTALGLDKDDVIGKKSASIVAGLKEDFPDGWTEEMIVEVKSINSMAFWNSKGNKDVSGKFVGYAHNRMQLYGYLVMSGLRQGFLLYVSKDDFTLAEVPVTIQDTELEQKFYEDVEKMTYYIRNKIQPEPEPIVLFNEATSKFDLNWAVTRSLYLSKLYGYADEAALSYDYHQHLLDINRAFRHLKTGKVKAEDLDHIEAYNMEALVDSVPAEGEADND